MLDASKAYTGFAVDDPKKAKEFYGRDARAGNSGPRRRRRPAAASSSSSATVEILIYPKPDLAPANYTVLNFPVGDVEATVDELAAKGVTFERYDGFEQDEKGIDRNGPAGGIAWFKDPAGNILAVHGEM